MSHSKGEKSRKLKNTPVQRKTTLKWSSDGELSAIDMARILDRLSNPELVQCELPSKPESKDKDNSYP